MVKEVNRKGLISTIPGTRDRTSKASKVREGALIARRQEREVLAAAVEAATSHEAEDSALVTDSFETDQPSTEQERAWEVERELKDERAKVNSLEDEIFAEKSRHTRLEAELKEIQDRIDAVDPNSTIIRPEHQVTIDTLVAKVAVVTKQIREANAKLGTLEHERKAINAQLTVLERDREVMMQENEDLEKEVAELESLLAATIVEEPAISNEVITKLEPVGKKAKATAKKERADYAALERKAASLKILDEEVQTLKSMVELNSFARIQIPIVREQLEREKEELQRLEKLTAAMPTTPPGSPLHEDQAEYNRKVEALTAQVAELEGEKLRGEWDAAHDASSVASFADSRPMSSSGASGSGEHEFVVGQLVETIRSLNESMDTLRSEKLNLLLQLAGVDGPKS